MDFLDLNNYLLKKKQIKLMKNQNLFLIFINFSEIFFTKSYIVIGSAIAPFPTYLQANSFSTVFITI